MDISDDVVNLDEDVDVTSGGESEMEDEEVYFSYMPSDYSEET